MRAVSSLICSGEEVNTVGEAKHGRLLVVNRYSGKLLVINPYSCTKWGNIQMRSSGIKSVSSISFRDLFAIVDLLRTREISNKL
jgi:hypothetical protein